MAHRTTTESARAASSVFATTQWTRVLAARGNSEEARTALSDLCEGYYRPIVKFLRCSGHGEDAALELAHSFIAKLLEGEALKRLERERGRFRSYLLGALKHFVTDAREREQAAKRGGRSEHVALDVGTDTSPGIDPPDANLKSPEAEFDRQWALTVLDRALNQLADELKAEGRKEHFEILKPWLTGESGGETQADAARRLGMNEGAVKVAIHRLRKRFRHLIKSEIASTVSSPDQVEEEHRNLIAALS